MLNQFKQHKNLNPQTQYNISEKNKSSYTIIFNRIEPLGYHVLNYYIRFQIQGESWESPVVRGGQHQQINIRRSPRKISKLYEQQEQIKSKKSKKWVVQTQGGDSISSVIKFIEKNQEKQKYKGKACIVIQNSGNYQVFIYKEAQSKQQKNINNLKSNVIFQKKIQKSQIKQNKGKRIACIEFQVIKNNYKANHLYKGKAIQRSKMSNSSYQQQYLQKNKQQILKTNSKFSNVQVTSDAQQERIAYIAPMIEQQFSLLQSIVAQKKNQNSNKNFDRSNIKVQEINLKYNNEIMLNNKHQFFQQDNQQIELDKYLRENQKTQKEQQQILNKILQQDRFTLEKLKNDNQKRKNKQLLFNKINNKKKLFKNFNFKKKIQNFSQNSFNAYQIKENQQKQQNEIYDFQTQVKNNISFNKFSQFCLNSRYKNDSAGRYQTVKYFALLKDFTLQCNIKPHKFQIFYKNLLNNDEKVLFNSQSKYSHQYKWQYQVQVQYELPINIELRARVYSTQKQIFQGNINAKDSNNCTFLQKTNINSKQTKQIILLKYNKKKMKFIETKFQQLMQIPQQDKKKQNLKNKEINKVGKIFKQSQQIYNKNFQAAINIKNKQKLYYKNKSSSYQQIFQKNKTNSQQKALLVQQKIDLVKSMLYANFPFKKENNNLNSIIKKQIDHKEQSRQSKIFLKQIFSPKTQITSFSSKKNSNLKKAYSQFQTKIQLQDDKLNDKQKLTQKSLKNQDFHFKRNNILNMQKFTQNQVTNNKINLIYHKNFSSIAPKHNSKSVIQKYITNTKNIDRGEIKKNFQYFQILIHFIRINLTKLSPLTKKFIIIESYPQKSYRSQTLTCNNIFRWVEKKYLFKFFPSNISYEEQASLVIKLYQQTNQLKFVNLGKLLIPLSCLLESGQVYFGKINGIDFQPIGDIILQFKIIYNSHYFDRVIKSQRKSEKNQQQNRKQLFLEEKQQIEKISKKIDHIFEKYILMKKRPRTLNTSYTQKNNEENLQFRKNLKKQSSTKQQPKQFNKNSFSRRYTENNPIISYQKNNEELYNSIFAEKLRQLKRKCKYLTYENKKEQYQKNNAKSFEQKFQEKKKTISKIDLIKRKINCLTQVT